MCNGPTNALVCNKKLIQMSHIKTFKITPTCFDHQLIIISVLLQTSALVGPLQIVNWNARRNSEISNLDFRACKVFNLIGQNAELTGKYMEGSTLL
jgi:hypothetical protein